MSELPRIVYIRDDGDDGYEFTSKIDGDTYHHAETLSKATTHIDELERAINRIAPWLSASLEDHEHDGNGDYLQACNEIFRLDRILAEQLAEPYAPDHRGVTE